MLAGPTVRRLHREREGQAWEERSSRQQAVREGRGASGGSSAPLSPPVRIRATGPSLGHRSDFPLSMESLLEGTRSGDVAVLGGEILHITPRVPLPGEEGVELNGRRRGAYAGGRLRERLLQACERDSLRLYAWAGGYRAQGQYQKLDSICKSRSVGQVRRIEAFLEEELIPHLQAWNAGQSGIPTSPRRVDSLGAIFKRGLPGLEVEPAFAFVGSRWYDLVSFFGRPTAGRFHLRWGRQQFVGHHCQHRRRALERYDQLLERAVGAALAPTVAQGVRTLGGYRDACHAVVRTPKGHHFLCRYLPPYAVEGPDRRLYRFGAVEIGLWIGDTDPARVIRSGAARVMHSYRHMFLLGGDTGSVLCMPRHNDFFHRLHRMPLAQALLEYLEEARMTLCSGYFEDSWSIPYHDVRELDQRVIEPEEARAQGLPVYRYYRKKKARKERS